MVLEEHQCHRIKARCLVIDMDQVAVFHVIEPQFTGNFAELPAEGNEPPPVHGTVQRKQRERCGIESSVNKSAVFTGYLAISATAFSRPEIALTSTWGL